jgi:hypothetical protein
MAQRYDLAWLKEKYCYMTIRWTDITHWVNMLRHYCNTPCLFQATFIKNFKYYNKLNFVYFLQNSFKNVFQCLQLNPPMNFESLCVFLDLFVALEISFTFKTLVLDFLGK